MVAPGYPILEPRTSNIIQTDNHWIPLPISGTFITGSLENRNKEVPYVQAFKEYNNKGGPPIPVGFIYLNGYYGVYDIK